MRMRIDGLPFSINYITSPSPAPSNQLAAHTVHQCEMKIAETHLGDGSGATAAFHASCDADLGVASLGGQIGIVLHNGRITPRGQFLIVNLSQRARRQIQFRRIGYGMEERNRPGQDGQMHELVFTATSIDLVELVLGDGDVTRAEHDVEIRGRIHKGFTEFFNPGGGTHGTVTQAHGGAGLLRQFFHDVPIAFGRIGGTTTVQLQDMMIADGIHRSAAQQQPKRRGMR